MRKAPLPAHGAAADAGCWKPPTVAPCFWMRSAKCRCTCKPGCCARWKKAVTRVGGQQPVAVDFRVISATHNHLEQAIQRGDFRADLFYRLSALRLQLPPLRARGDDIAMLAEHFLKRSLAALDVPLTEPLRAALAGCYAALNHYAWPGNLRELRNMMERVALMLSTGAAPSGETLRWLLPELAAGTPPETPPAPVSAHEALARCGATTPPPPGCSGSAAPPYGAG